MIIIGRMFSLLKVVVIRWKVFGEIKEVSFIVIMLNLLSSKLTFVVRCLSIGT